MKNCRFVFAAALAAAALSGCQKEMTDNLPKEDQSSYNVTVIAGSETVKTEMGGNDEYVNWTEDDAITLFEEVDGTLNGSFNSSAITITGTEPNTAEFTVPVSGTDPEGSSYVYTACYPAGKIVKSGSDYQYLISSTQTLSEDGGFDPEQDVLIGKQQTLTSRIGSDPLSVKFHRAGTVGKLTIKGITAGEKIQSVTITLPDAVYVTGKCSVDLSTAQSTLVTGYNTITLTSEDGIAAETDGNAVYFRCLVGTWPAGSSVQFEVTTDAKTYLKTVTLPKDYEFTESGLTTMGISNFTTAYDPNDYLSMYNNGIDFTICGEVINKATYGDASTLGATSINDAFTTKGIYFVNNKSDNRTWSYGGGRTKSMVAGTVLIGRYKNYPQPVMKQAYATDKQQGCFIFNDGVKILNYRIEAKDKSYGIFQGQKGVDYSGSDTFRFQDCTLVNENNFLTSFNNGTYAVPKAMYFDNCIIRVKGTVVKGGNNTSNKPEKLETLSFNNTVFAPYSASETVSATSSNGCLFDFASTVNATIALNIDMSYCTVYEYQPAQKTRGLIEVKDYANINIDYTAFYHSSYDGFDDSKYYTAYAATTSTLTTGGISVSATYSNSVESVMLHGTGSKSTLAPSPRTWSVNITTADQTVVTSSVDATKDYFPVHVTVGSANKSGGASYDTKPWVTSQLESSKSSLSLPSVSVAEVNTVCE